MTDQIEVDSPSIVCAGDPVSVLVSGAQPGVNYSIFTDAGERVSEEILSTSKDFRIVWRPKDAGDLTVWLYARSACAEIRVRKIELKIAPSPEVHASDIRASYGESVTLRVDTPSDDLTYSWFATSDAKDTLGRGITYQTPPIRRPTRYFVCGTIVPGCSSALFPVEVSVMPYATLYPNPAVEKINFLTNGIVPRSVTIINSSGQVVLEVEWERGRSTEGKSINIGGLKDGVYVAIIYTDSTARFLKFIKK